jgi:hypothetical protein
MDRDLTKVGECVYDQGGYFVINGSEKVVIAQERLSNNHVYVFKKQQPHKFEWICEIRSHIVTGARPTSTIQLQMHKAGGKLAIGGKANAMFLSSLFLSARSCTFLSLSLLLRVSLPLLSAVLFPARSFSLTSHLSLRSSNQLHSSLYS